jgi:hypothetical protein
MSIRYPNYKCGKDTVFLGDKELTVKYDYFAGQPARLYGPPEKCCEGIPARVDIIEVLFEGSWISAQFLGREQSAIWEQQILDRIQTEEQEIMADRP